MGDVCRGSWRCWWEWRFFPTDGCTWRSYDDGDDGDGGDDDDGDSMMMMMMVMMVRIIMLLRYAKMRVWGIGKNGIALEASLLLFRLRLARFWSNNGSPFHPKTTLDAEPVWPVAHIYVDEFVILILLATILLQPSSRPWKTFLIARTSLGHGFGVNGWIPSVSHRSKWLQYLKCLKSFIVPNECPWVS